MNLESLSFAEFVEIEMKKYWKYFYSLSKEEQDKELLEAVRWYTER